MAYVAVKGGREAIEASLKRLKYERIKSRNLLDVKKIKCGMRGLIDMVMSEAGVYSEDLAATALKQAEGNTEEAVFLLRAYRSTLPRKYYTTVTETKNMFAERRISAAFKDIEGGQILGACYDYTHRLIDFDIENEKEEDINQWLEEFCENSEKPDESLEINLRKLPKVIDYLRAEGLIKDYEKSSREPSDITKKSIEFPAQRCERLQCLTRGQTGGVIALGYSSLRTSGLDNHPTVGELRVGFVPLYISDPLKKDEEDEYYIGEIKVTEAESFIPNEKNFDIGYGICFGQNESKAIAMSILDQCLERKDPRYPAGDEEFVLLSIDSVESGGFISHLKLPHYVTFQSKLDSTRNIKNKGGKEYEKQI